MSDDGLPTDAPEWVVIWVLVAIMIVVSVFFAALFGWGLL